jgi:hypothetical protein
VSTHRLLRAPASTTPVPAGDADELLQAVEAEVTDQLAVPVQGVALRRAAKGGDDPLGGTAAEPSVVAALQRQSGQGEPLPPEIAERFEQQYGFDFGNVRVHSDPAAATLADQVQARAFTHGNDIYFAAGAFDPGAPDGQRLIGHELAHVVQEKGGVALDTDAGVQRSVLRRDPPTATATAPTTTTPSTEAPTTAPLTTAPPTTAPPTSASATPVAQSDVERFTALVAGAAPADAGEAKQRLIELRAIVTALSEPQRRTLWSDDALMAKARVYLGGVEFMGLVAALGMAHQGSVAHKSGTEVDTVIRTCLGTGPLKPFIEAAVGKGRQAEGFVAILDNANWARVYESEFPSEPVGSEEELETNAFTSTTQSDSPIVLNADRGNPGTAIHEGMHRYQDDAVLNSYGSEFNEALTEYFTRKVTEHPDVAIDRDNYEDNLDWLTDAFVPMLGAGAELLLAAAYYSGTVAPLKQAFVDFRKAEHGETGEEAEEAWTELLEDVQSEDWDDAKDACKP